MVKRDELGRERKTQCDGVISQKKREEGALRSNENWKVTLAMSVYNSSFVMVSQILMICMSGIS